MAAAREHYDNPYEDVGGFGKFRKRPFRRSTRSTPYDRPQTAIRNPSANTANNRHGWLSKLVDPTQRFIASSAHRLFASFFRKSLPPPPPPLSPPEPELNRGAMDKQHEATSTGPPDSKNVSANGCDTPVSISDGSGVTELEVILKQKTFTKSEIDRLTALLQSRGVHTGEENKSDVVASKADLHSSKKEKLASVPSKDNWIENRITPAPIRSNAVDEDAATPAEMAKSYMRSRLSKVSPPNFALFGQLVHEGSSSLTKKACASNSPVMSIVSRPSDCPGFPVNGFITPRSRGRSAIYNMARTPYSRLHSTTNVQGAGTASDASGGPSSSRSTWALKRRSSVLENDIGSIGPIRRIRQKVNILPTSRALSIRRTGFDSDTAQPPISAEKRALGSETLVENDDNSIHQSRLRSVTSKSSEMASRILQQLDALVSSRERSPTKLSTSMLHGPALRSLDNIDSPKFLENAHDKNKLDVQHENPLSDVRDMSQKHEAKENGPSIFDANIEESALAFKAVDAAIKVGEAAEKVAAFSTMRSVVQPPPQQKRSFQISAHEDCLELDDDEDVTAVTLTEGEQPVSTFTETRSGTCSAISVKSSASPETTQRINSVINQNSEPVSDGCMVVENRNLFTFQAATSPNVTVEQAAISCPSTMISASPQESNVPPPIFSFGDKIVSRNEPNGISTMVDFNSKTEDKPPMLFTSTTSSTVSGSSGPKFDDSAVAEPENSNRFATESAKKEAELDKAEHRNTLKASFNFRSSEKVPSSVSNSSSEANIFSFGMPASDSSLINGTLASAPSLFSSPVPPLGASDLTVQSSSIPVSASSRMTSSDPAFSSTAGMTAGSTSIISASASSPAFATTPVFKFGSTVVSDPAPTGIESAESKNRRTNPADVNGALFVGSSSAITSTGNAIFGGKSPTAGAVSSIYGGTSSSTTTNTGCSSFIASSSAVRSTGSGTFSFSVGATGSAHANQSQRANPFSNGSAVPDSSTQSMPSLFGLSASSPSFGLAGNAPLTSGSCVFNSSSSSGSLFSSGATFGMASSSASGANMASSSTMAGSTAIGSTWQTRQSPVFGSTFNSSSSSTGFAFDASVSGTGTTGTSVMFKSSTSAPSVPVFSFSSTAPATTTQAVFGNSNSGFGFGFGLSAANNNDQMNMEDSMAEDTVQASTPPTGPVFNQLASTPSSGLIFGATTPSGLGQFGSPSPSVANPFQFGGQPNLAAPQNPSLFQASGSLEFNGAGAGSFSLGTGGSDKSGRKIVRVKKGLRKK
ncbi:hypothetical protein K2173_025114 [Erythroxylum novogranatense]|uniref:Nuclear pore complex protein n=1 Tax=Erythroxylum novogranatense TaxID=1862640 RepID=A0AAV8SVN3_9ROSI|nr:hypothetical protein K2173_025114 [Erythroxylum novogranatense]